MLSREPLSPRQREVLQVIRGFISANDMPPTVRDLMEILSINSTNGMNDHLKALEKKGYIVRLPLKSRGIRVLADEFGRDLKPVKS